VYVTNFGARAYCVWRGGDLPTVNEWVRAARGDDDRRYPWGGLYDASKANLKGAEDGFAGPAPVSAFAESASPFGAVQMAGNVYEWLRSGDLRGGYWLGRAEELEIDFAESNAPSTANEHDGFRCVWEP
jgi:formylglycine-generating enzyme required for sulfatase activity